MTKQVFLDCRTFVSGADLSGWGNKIEVGEEWEAKATTNWRSGGAVERLAGIGDVDIDAAGQWEAGDLGKPDDEFWANRRIIEPWTIAPDGQSDLAAGTLVYLAKALRLNSKYLGAVGDVAPWSMKAKGSGGLVRGLSSHPSGVPRTVTGTGTILDLGVAGGPTALQALYANLHVLSVAGTGGPSLTVTVQSSTLIGFGAPTNRGSFAAKTAIGGEAIRIAGPITDRYWRLSWAITGTTPSFLFMSSLGID